MKIKLIGHEFNYDITSLVMLFFPGEKVEYCEKHSRKHDVVSILKKDGNNFISITKIKHNNKWHLTQKTAHSEVDAKNLVKQTFYKACKKCTGINSPWGVLTGVRPTSVFAKCCNDAVDAVELMKKEYYVSHDKAILLKNIYNYQNSYLRSGLKDVSIYVSIPFCPTKCSYCSFISIGATKKGELIQKYLVSLFDEIRYKAMLVEKYSLNIKSLYVGGGTPGILDEVMLESLLEVLESSFKISELPEVSFEIGRPETITERKLELLKKYNVNRICINTQSTNDEVLKFVNRNHTAKQFFDALYLAKKYCFNSINTDLIAGLPNEDYVSFCNSLEDVIAMNVDNITVHTLAIKRASLINDSKRYYKPLDEDVSKMIEYAYNRLNKNGYIPYYIYRQKNCVSNGENIGFCKPDKLCTYNIFMMEDVHSILACGAGASSKLIKNGKVERVINVKYPMEYTSEFDKIIKNNEKMDKILKVNLTND